MASFASSYIPTVASQVTRAADSASMIGNNFARWYNQTEGTVYGQWGSVSTSSSVVNASDGTTNNRITIQNDNSFQGAVLTGGAVQASLDGGTLTAVNKAAFACKANDFALSLSGGAAVTDSVGSVPNADRLILGANGAGTASFLNGTISRIAYYNRRLANTELTALTS